MSVDYTAVLAVGKEFDEQGEAEDFLRENGFLRDVTEEEMEDEGLTELLPEALQGSCLNYYYGYGFYLGFHISCRDVESFKKNYEEGVEKWDKMFPNTPAEIVHTVIVS